MTQTVHSEDTSQDHERYPHGRFAKGGEVKSDKETGHICDNWCSHNCKTCLIKGKTCARHRWGDDTPVRGSLDECSGVVSRKGEFVPCSRKVAGKGVSDVTGVVLYMCDRHLDAVRYAVFERGWKWHIEELEGE